MVPKPFVSGLWPSRAWTVLAWVPAWVLGSDVIIRLPHDTSELEGTLSPLRKLSPQCVSAGDPGPWPPLPAFSSQEPPACCHSWLSHSRDLWRFHRYGPAAAICAPPGPALRGQVSSASSTAHIKPLLKTTPIIVLNPPSPAPFMSMGWGFQVSCHHPVCCFCTHTCLPAFFWKCGFLNKELSARWIQACVCVCVCVYKILF